MLGKPLRDLSDHPSERGLNYLRAANAAQAAAWWVASLAFVAALAVIVEVLADRALELAIAALVLLVLALVWFGGVLPALVIRFYRHEITDDAVLIQRGFFTRRFAVVPFARVQSVAMNRGPVERRFGLGTVVLQTAAGSESIPLLDDDVADELRARLTERARRSGNDI